MNKKIILIIGILLLCASISVWAQDGDGGVSVGIPLMLTYQFPFNDINSIASVDFINTFINNSRLSLGIQLLFDISNTFSLGAETGLVFYIPSATVFGALFESGPVPNLVAFDIPLHVLAGLDFGIINLDIYGGGIFINAFDNNFATLAFDLGTRLGIKAGTGSFIIDLAYVLPAAVPLAANDISQAILDYNSNYLRVGLGYRFLR